MITHTNQLDNKVALVTGASRGIGAAIARAYAQAGRASSSPHATRRRFTASSRS